MKITAVETVRNAEFPALIWVQIHTDEGITGLGETTFGVQAVEEFIHESAAPYLVGKDPLHIDRHWSRIKALGFAQMTRSTETRALSAIDVALWDIFGQAVNMPIHQLLGGPSRDSVRVYNTCAGYHYGIRRASGKSDYTSGDGDFAIDLTGNRTGFADEGPYEDMQAFLTHADDLAESLLSEGVTAMKIWPFDRFYQETMASASHCRISKKASSRSRRFENASATG